MEMTEPLVAVVGPTAAGKSALALELAERFGGEIVGADSRQIYRRMDIGTAKPTPEERARVPHHLIDSVEPDQPYDLARYQREAYAAVDAIAARGRLPLLVGGTGLYVRAVTEGYQLPAVEPRPEWRRAMEERAARIGAEALHAELAACDPRAAARIDPRNVRRVIRALELAEAGVSAASEPEPRYRVLRLGVGRPRAELYRRIDDRIDAMLAAGWLDEVRRLLQAGYNRRLPSMSGLGYRDLVAYLLGERTFAEAVTATKHGTHRFARQQGTWFRPDDPQIRWLDGGDPASLDRAIRAVGEFLGRSDQS